MPELFILKMLEIEDLRELEIEYKMLKNIFDLERDIFYYLAGKR